MKKTLYAILVLVSVSILSCRQQDEILSQDDIATLRIVESPKQTTPKPNVVSDSLNVAGDSAALIADPGDPAKPPKR